MRIFCVKITSDLQKTSLYNAVKYTKWFFVKEKEGQLLMLEVKERIYIADDDANIREGIKIFLER